MRYLPVRSRMHFRQLVLVLIMGLPVCGMAFGGDVHVTFRVVVPRTLAPLTHVYIASSVNGWSDSSPVWKMTPIGSNSFALELDLQDSLRVEYHYTLGERYCLESTQDGKPRNNRSVVVAEGVVQSDTVARWSMESANAGRWLEQDVSRVQGLWLAERLQMTYPENKLPDNPVRRVRSIYELDSLIKEVQTEWRAVSLKEYEGVLPDLLSPWYSSIVGMVGERTLYLQARDYVLERYQLPTFFSEYADLRQAPTGSKTHLLSASLITLQFGIDMYWLSSVDSLSYSEVPALAQNSMRRMEHWRQLSAIFSDAPRVLDEYLANPGLSSDQGLRSSLTMVKLMLEQWRPSWEIMDHLLSQRRDLALKAFRQIRCDGKDGIGSDAYQRIATPLLMELARKGEADGALDVADSLLAAAIRAFPSDTSMWSMYRGLYARADSLRGPARYSGMVARNREIKSPHAVAKAVQESPLTGRFFDIVSQDTIDLATLRGKIVALDFWTTWCGPCISSIPEIDKYHREISTYKDVALISILCDATLGEQFVSKFVAKQKISYPVLLERQDRSLGRRFDINWYPSMAVLDRQGKVDLSPKDATTWRKVKERVAVLRQSE